MKYTAGPWAIAAGPTYCAIRTDARVIADMRLVGLHYNKADADLIAAAPDLLEALKEMLDNHEDACTGYGEGAAEKARDAIAKATGAA
jgi:hypothetical protein